MSEEIIIDGVNVAECRFLDEWKHCDICEKLCDSKCLIVEDIECKTYDDCYFKQLKRLQAENEELKIYIESNKQQVEEVETLVMDNDRLSQETENYKQALEEISEMFDNCCFKANFLNNCDSDCKYINECNGELSVIQKRISEVLK